MFTLLLRLIFVYFLTLLSTRFMGKRQIGELQLSELVSAFFLSELATYFITDLNVPLSYAVIPIASIIVMEVAVSYLSIKSVLLKKLFDDPPSFLIKKGKLIEKELNRNRITLGELMSQIRQCGVSDISMVNYAILESNGKISIIPKAPFQSLTPEDAGIQTEETGISHALIVDGKIDTDALKSLGRDRAWLNKQLEKHGVTDPAQVFFMTANDLLEIYVTKKEIK